MSKGEGLGDAWFTSIVCGLLFGGIFGLIGGMLIPTVPRHYTDVHYGFPAYAKHGEQPHCLTIGKNADSPTYTFLMEDGAGGWTSDTLQKDSPNIDSITLKTNSDVCEFSNRYVDSVTVKPGYEWEDWVFIRLNAAHAWHQNIVLSAPRDRIVYQ